MATAQANAAAPLDQLLVDAGAGPLRRWLPGHLGVEFIASMAGKPRRSAGDQNPCLRELRSRTKNGKDLITMSETPITQQAEAAVTRINQLTERMLTADRVAGAGLAAAHEKALQSLVDNPADLKRPVEWVQSLAEVHAKFIEETTDALVKTAGEAASDVPATGVLDEATAQRIRSLNQQVLARASAAGTGAVDGYEKALQDMADFETKIASSSQLDWLQAVASSHTKFVTDLVSMYASAIRTGLSG
jgi:hypothetical protein